jgi:hypothetical protein
MARRSPPPTDREVEGDAAHPRLEVFVLSHAGPLLPQPRECLLHDLFGLSTTRRNDKQLSDESWIRFSINFLERLVAPCRSFVSRRP